MARVHLPPLHAHCLPDGSGSNARIRPPSVMAHASACECQQQARHSSSPVQRHARPWCRSRRRARQSRCGCGGGRGRRRLRGPTPRAEWRRCAARPGRPGWGCCGTPVRWRKRCPAPGGPPGSREELGSWRLCCTERAACTHSRKAGRHVGSGNCASAGCCSRPQPCRQNTHTNVL
jgi:hypothetical protein